MFTFHIELRPELIISEQRTAVFSFGVFFCRFSCLHETNNLTEGIGLVIPITDAMAEPRKFPKGEPL